MSSRVARIAFMGLELVGIAMLLLWPTSRYEWVRDVDPAMDPSRFEDASNSNSVVAIGLLTLVLAAATGAFLASRSRRSRATITGLAIVALGIWAVRFGL